MPAERLPMRKVREVLRQRYACGASERVIAQSPGIGRTAVGEYIRRAAVIGITWPVPGELDDAALERKLFAPAGYNPPQSKPLPDWAHVHAELRRRGVTLALLWQDYRGQHPDGYGYSRFCDLYGEWRRGVTATMRQTHAAGEKLFVDFAGDTMAVFDGLTGEARDAKIFSLFSGRRTTPTPSPASARRCPTGSACTSMRSPSWAGTTSRPGSRPPAGTSRG
jgi:transposase